VIGSIVLDELLSFDKAQLHPDVGLNVFSGPSGAGKSVLMEGLLSFFGHKEAKAAQGTMELDGAFGWESVGFEPEDEAIIRYQKKEKIRYFLNDQAITKKGLTTFSGEVVKYLTLKEASELSSEAVISFMDGVLSRENQS
jgi:DNA repair protein RecN (Recombination protein N)